MQWDEHGGRITDHKSDPRPVIHSGRKSDVESSAEFDAATAQNRAQQAPARSRKESQDGMETDQSSRVITVSPDKTGVVYKRIVGGTGFEPVVKSSGNNGRGTQSAAESAALDAREAPLGSDLRAVISAWPNLPDAIRSGILAMIGATK